MLDTDLRRKFIKQCPPFVLPSLVDSAHKPGDSLIVTGYAREIGTDSQFVGFISVPVMIGHVSVPMVIPVQNLYTVIEIFDDENELALAQSSVHRRRKASTCPTAFSSVVCSNNSRAKRKSHQRTPFFSKPSSGQSAVDGWLQLLTRGHNVYAFHSLKTVSGFSKLSSLIQILR